MPKPPHLTQNENNLIRRYLIWCYKTTKEDLDHIDRYYTQYMADQYILSQLKKEKTIGKENVNGYKSQVKDFEAYLNKKKTNVDSQKFLDKDKKQIKSEYQYLKNRFRAIEKAICHFLSRKELAKIERLYEEEMTQRILSAREHA